MRYSLIALMFFCCHFSFASKETLKITGSSTIAPVAIELTTLFEDKNKDIRLEVQTGGSSRGILDTRRGLAHIGMVSRALKVKEADLKAHRVALDGIAIVVHRDNPISNITTDLVRKIFKKEIKNWKGISSDGGDIVVVNKASGRSTLEVFSKFFRLRNRDIKPDVIIGDNEQGIKTIAANKNSIGYISIGSAEQNILSGVPIKMLSLNGKKPSVSNLINGSYPLSRELNFVTHGTLSLAQKRFLTFLRTKQANEVFKKMAFVPVSQ